MDALTSALAISGSGLQTQSVRMRVVAENLANAQSTGETPGADAFRRKLVTLRATAPDVDGFARVEIGDITPDRGDFRIEHDPAHPAADVHGDVKYPNVNPLIELADMREATRAYEANLQVMKQARSLVTMTIDLLRER